MGSVGSCSTIPPVINQFMLFNTAIEESGFQQETVEIQCKHKNPLTLAAYNRKNVLLHVPSVCVTQHCPRGVQIYLRTVGQQLKLPGYVLSVCRSVCLVTDTTCLHLLSFLSFRQDVVRQKVRRQLTKQQKAAQRRRLQKGEANLVTKSRRENQSTIKSSVESASFWG